MAPRIKGAMLHLPNIVLFTGSFLLVYFFLVSASSYYPTNISNISTRPTNTSLAKPDAPGDSIKVKK